MTDQANVLEDVKEIRELNVNTRGRVTLGANYEQFDKVTIAVLDTE